MKTLLTTLKRLGAGILFVAIPMIGGCGNNTLTWQEEVQLSDGRTITVEREIRFESGGGEWAHNRSLSKPKEHRIQFQLANQSGQTIEWRSIKEWRGWPESPLILDIEIGQPVVITIGGEPCEQYFKYVYRNGVWSEEILPIRIDARTTNLYLREDGKMKLVSIAEKQNENSSVDYGKWLKQVGPDTRVCH